MTDVSPTSSLTSPGTKSAEVPELRPAVFDDYAQIEKLESTHDLLTLSATDWRALYTENPVNRLLSQDRAIGWVLVDSKQRIVGSLANIIQRYMYRGTDLIAATGRAWVVAEEYRGIAIWLIDEYFNQPGVDLFLNTTVNSMAVDPFTSFGSSKVPVGDWESAAYWITNYLGFARVALKLKKVPAASLFSPLVGLGLRAKDCVASHSIPVPNAQYQISELPGFGNEFDRFWQELVGLNTNKLMGFRDSQSLTWHFTTPLRHNHLWIVTARKNNLMRAYGIFKRQDHPPSGLTRMRLVDFQTVEPADSTLLTSILHHAHKKCRAQKIHTLEHVGCNLPKTQRLDQLAPYRRQLPAWPFYYAAADPSLDAALKSPDAWDASTYDGDSSL